VCARAFAGSHPSPYLSFQRRALSFLGLLCTRAALVNEQVKSHRECYSLLSLSSPFAPWSSTPNALCASYHTVRDSCWPFVVASRQSSFRQKPVLGASSEAALTSIAPNLWGLHQSGQQSPAQHEFLISRTSWARPFLVGASLAWSSLSSLKTPPSAIPFFLPPTPRQVHALSSPPRRSTRLSIHSNPPEALSSIHSFGISLHTIVTHSSPSTHSFTHTVCALPSSSHTQSNLAIKKPNNLVCYHYASIASIINLYYILRLRIPHNEAHHCSCSACDG
jgi:hypothetical protein